MTEGQRRSPEDLGQKELAELVADMLHRTIVHHVLWFREVEHQFGLDKALDLLGRVWPQSRSRQMERLGRALGFAVEDGIPLALQGLPRESLLALLGDLGRNWLAGDGIWFQAVEAAYGMNDAKRCNDTCWTRFSPFEARSILQFLGLSPAPGLDGLKKALRFRLYALINRQGITKETPESFVFQMNDCLVQSARKRRGLPDYPCKSAGLVEYRAFAETIDPRIQTACIACPPDGHPEEWFCAWRFTLPPEEGAAF